MTNFTTSVKQIDGASTLKMTGITKVGHLGESVLVIKFRHSIFILALNDCAHGHFTRFNEAHLMNDEDATITYWATIGSLTDLVYGETPFKHITTNRGRLQPYPVPIFGNVEGYRNALIWNHLTMDENVVNRIVKFATEHLRSYQETYEPQKLKPRNPPR